MANILTTVEISPEGAGYMVLVSMNGQLVSSHGPVPDLDTAEKLQDEQVRIVQTVIRDQMKRIRERLANPH